ncbi:MAG: choice-of-anchor D domain-containing protein [Acidobacteriia bacterium]|nr:choice-of-anchor D domain-containing protein [Terriglobia bacterium]
MKKSFLRMMILALAGGVSAFAAGPQYALIVNGSQTPFSTGVFFPGTAVGATSTATVVIVNQGDGAGTVSAITATGSSYQISGLPTLPKTLQPNDNIAFFVSFNPSSTNLATGSVTVTLDNTPTAIPLKGQGTGAVLRVENLTASPVTTISADGTLSFPNTDVGKSATITMRVTNDGEAAGTITPTVVGSNFALTNVIPQQLTLSPHASTTFNVVFTPVNIGALTAQLLITNSFAINLSGTGQGANLTFSPVTNGVILFPNTAVGSSAAVTLTITNTGNVATSVTSVGVPKSAFSISSTLALPLNLPPGGTATIGLLFTPNAVGALTSTLVIDSKTFNLQGVGSAPASLPAISFSGAGDTATPLQQPAVGLQLATTYPQDLTGTLTLTFTPDSFADDPNIQFSSGGRTVSFRIPANTTSAVFGQSNQVPFSAGTVAGMITLTPSFAVNGVDVTPKPVTVKTIQIASSAPVLRSLQIGTRTASSFELLITGYATSRSVSGLVLNFTPSAGSTLSTTSIPVNSDSAFSSWYQTSASQSVGSQFTASLTITLGGNGNAVQSVSVSASNAKGASNAVSVNLQ